MFGFPGGRVWGLGFPGGLVWVLMLLVCGIAAVGSWWFCCGFLILYRLSFGCAAMVFWDFGVSWVDWLCGGWYNIGLRVGFAWLV